MRAHILIAVVSLGFTAAVPIAAAPAAAQERTTAIPPSGPIKIESYYQVRWGKEEEFLDLYRANHLPIQKALIDDGLITSVLIEFPATHMSGEGAWHVRVTTVWRDSLAAWWQNELPQWRAARARLYPDSDSHAAAERARLELLDAHWDVVIYPD